MTRISLVLMTLLLLLCITRNAGGQIRRMFWTVAASNSESNNDLGLMHHTLAPYLRTSWRILISHSTIFYVMLSSIPNWYKHCFYRKNIKSRKLLYRRMILHKIIKSFVFSQKRQKDKQVKRHLTQKYPDQKSN